LRIVPSLAPQPNPLTNTVDLSIFLYPVFCPFGLKGKLGGAFSCFRNGHEIGANTALFDNLIGNPSILKAEMPLWLFKGGINDRISIMVSVISRSITSLRSFYYRMDDLYGTVYTACCSIILKGCEDAHTAEKFFYRFS
jgi:hypothetical protein